MKAIKSTSSKAVKPVAMGRLASRRVHASLRSDVDGSINRRKSLSVIGDGFEFAGSSLSTESCEARDIALSFLLHDVSRMRRVAYDRIVKPIGTTSSQWRVLVRLSQCNGATQSQLADAMKVGRPSIGDLLESLQSSGLIRRSPSSDGRVKRVFLTRRSQSLVAELTAIETKFNREILGDLSAAERDLLRQLLGTVKHQLSRFLDEKKTNPLRTSPSGS